LTSTAAADAGELKSFEEDPEPDAVKRLIEKLLETRVTANAGPALLDRRATASPTATGRMRIAPMPGLPGVCDPVLNQDKPYDRFVREQLAGDEIDRDIRTL